jgi:hypothetical protein
MICVHLLPIIITLFFTTRINVKIEYVMQRNKLYYIIQSSTTILVTQCLHFSKEHFECYLWFEDGVTASKYM